MRYLIGDLGRRYGVARAGAAGGYLRSDDEALLAEILRSKAAGALGLRRLAPTVLVSASEPVELVTQLRTAGWLVAAEGADGVLAVARPDADRAEPALELARLRFRRPGTGRCFGPVDRLLANVLADRAVDAAPEPSGRPAGVGPLPGEQEQLAMLLESLNPAVMPWDQLEAGEPERPPWTAYGATNVAMLLELALGWDWIVQLVDRRGLQCIVLLLEIEGSVLLAEDLAEGTYVRMPLPQTARVLSEQEEAAWL